jgi:uncharacterized protein (TIGR01777 family)
MRVAVTGATGTIGSAVVGALRARGDDVVALARDADAAARRLGAGVQIATWAAPDSEPPPAGALAGSDAVVHLLGEPIDQRWTADAKRRIRDSRVNSTTALAAALTALAESDRPGVLVSQSASGYYGAGGDEPVGEDTPPGDDFLAQVVVAWEDAARRAEGALRVVRTRTGVVLSPSGGALAKMLPFFRAGVGGPVAGGRQYVPWIHQDDVAGALLRCIDDAQLAGPVNVTAPTPVTNAELSKALGRVLHRPAVLPVPGFALKLMYGEMAQVVTEGRRVVPERLLAAGHTFAYPELEPALRAAVGH